MAKKTYTKPRLEVYGGVAVLTKASGVGVADLPLGNVTQGNPADAPKRPKGS